jgi:hypothetical protein
MNVAELYKKLQRECPRIEIRKDGPKTFRIFCFTLRDRSRAATIVTSVAGKYHISRISEYPTARRPYPRFIIEVHILRFGCDMTKPKARDT